MTAPSLTKNWQVVSVGLIYKNNQVLIGLRQPNKEKTNQWEFPGGSIESGELPQDTMIRELKEELGICVEKWELANCLCDYKQDQSYIIVFHHVLKWSGTIKKTCHEDLKWVSLSECKEKKLPNINPRLFDKIYTTLSNHLSL